ncbi:DUF1707 and DUF2154 domain-containing protein [Streptomyces sp. NA04227]|uniref:DUF1707 SHOCT-like domain-containing protein n=1 Tax=Streptomyces sp. NA04227 TaxID=2742136 RepID=UPI0015910223|nr:DUF1707 domain-containing protein [Streptomyces sp. NA04227]QKW06738.1 DUF1707 and DUF2154 domain-containing protein [Streptomyces sp. NA04227]
MTEEHPELRASDADRDRVAEVLRDALAEGRLDMEEFEERLEAAYRARTYGDLAPLTRDLPAAGATSLVKSPGGVAATAADDGVHWPARIGGPATSRGAFAFWSGFTRRGTWTVPRLFTAFAMWGGGEIDLREAHFEAEEVVLRCFSVMGGIQVTVPPELTVRVSGVGVMGGFGDEASGPGTPGSPQVTVTGFALMGGVAIERKLRRAERERLREERRAERLERREARGLAREERRERQLERRADRLGRDRHGGQGTHGGYGAHGHGSGHGRARGDGDNGSGEYGDR